MNTAIRELASEIRVGFEAVGRDIALLHGFSGKVGATS
jgi:hypothetical protein